MRGFTGHELAQAFQMAPLPPRFLGDFLHEATHHETFLHPVVAAFARQRLTSQMHAYLEKTYGAGPGGSGGQRAHLTNVVRLSRRQDLFLEMLRPVTEGLAQFAEFYSYRWRSYIHSSTSRSAEWCFGWPVTSEIQEEIATRAQSEHDDDSIAARMWLERMIQPLLEFRSSENAMLRLKAIYSLSLASAKGRTYLGGLLAVRRLYAAACSRITRFRRDPDLFLSYAMEFFYKDYQLVRLFYSDVDGERLVGNLHYIFARRFTRFLYEVDDRALDTWIEYTEDALGGAARGQVEKKLSGGLLLDADDLRTGLDYEARSEDDWQQFINSAAELGGRYARVLNGCMIGRALLPIARVPVTVSVTAAGELSVAADGEPIFEATLNTKIPFLGSREGHITMAILSPPGIELTPAKIFYLDVGGERLETIVFAAPKDQDRLYQHLDRVASDIWEAHTFATENELALIELRGDSTQRDYQGLIFDSLQHILQIVVSWPAPEDRENAILAALRAGGVRALMDFDIELLESVAYLGPVNSLVRRRSQLADWLPTVNVDETINHLLAIQDATGYVMLDASEDSLRVDL